MQAITKKEVSCKAFDPIFEYAKSNKVDLNYLIEGVPYNLAYLLNKRERVEWWVWCKIISNSNRFFSRDQYIGMGSDFVRRGAYFEGILWAFFLFTSSKFSRFLIKSIFQIGASMFTCMKQNTEFLEVNKIRITAFVGEGYEYCPEFFFLCKGVWEQLGNQIGRKNFKVILNIKEQKGVFDISWNKESIIFKLKRGLRWIFNIKKALLEVTDSHEHLLQQYEKLETSQKLLQKQTTQLKTAYEISTSIRQSLNINETLGIIANSLLKEGIFSFVSIRIFKDIDENEIPITVEAGNEKNLTNTIQQPIILDERRIGELILHPFPEVDYTECKELLEYLTPVIKIAIHDALTLRAIVDYRNNLELKVADRTSELQRARDALSDTNELLKEAQQTQSRFFTNISHEFRTPLTLILGPVKELIERTNDDKTKEDLNLVHRNAKRLLNLVNQLLDISKLESGSMNLHTVPTNLVMLVKAFTLSFTSYAERKRINLNFISDSNEIIVYVDKDKMEKIFTNVMSNAFKFTPDGGKIEVEIKASPKFSPKERTFKNVSSPPLEGRPVSTLVSQGGGVGQNEPTSSNFVEISIHDTGIGISRDKLPKIFDRFYQVDSSHTREHEGTGIGLSLTKELVELHKGSIEVESEEGRGTVVTVKIPLGKDHLKPEEIVEREQDEDKDYDRDKDKLIVEVEEGFQRKKDKKVDLGIIEKELLPLLLIVEDNSDVRNYIKNILQKEFAVVEAKDGEEGWNKCIESASGGPDLIISDVMMPKMDGFKLCDKLKTDERTSHIPIILLTAKATKNDKIDGFELGADDYIMKPFETDELTARVKNLIIQRKRLHEHFKKSGLLDFEGSRITSVDKKFLQKTLDIIKEHISNSSFNVESLSEYLSVSKSVLQKKISALTGETPVEFIRRLRLKKAVELIEKKFGNMSEIALEAGFGNPAYFSEVFKKEYGLTPKEYQQKISKN